MPTESRTEQLLNAYINGDDISNFVPLSRNEQILKDMILGNEQTSSPQSRIESLYKRLDEKIKQGSEDGNLDISQCLKKMFDESKSCEFLFYGGKDFFSGNQLYSYNNVSDEFLKIFFKDPNVTNNVLNMSHMFFRLYNVTTIPRFNTSNVTNMSYMFNRCPKITSIPEMDTSKVTDMSYMFENCYKLTTIPEMDTSNVTNMSHMFKMGYEDPHNGDANISSLLVIPKMNTSKVTDMGYMFNHCLYLTSIPEMDTSNVTNMSSMFFYCKSLTSIPEMDTSNVTNMNYMFGQCSNITTIPKMNTSKVTNMENMFEFCEKLTSIPEMDTSNVTNMNYMFHVCHNITTIPKIDMNNAKYVYDMFNGCSKLTYLKLLNIKVNLKIGSGTYDGHLIEKDCLIQIISELIDTGSSKTLTMGTVNTAKLSNTYVKLLEDDGTGKYPFEVCESTDEGAMTITDYCTAKNWTLA